MSSFMDLLKTESAKTDMIRTENGALAYKSTGRKLLDLNFASSSFRSKTDHQIVDAFMEAFSEDRIYAMTWLFYCRDCRNGMGERRFFRVVMKYLAARDQYAPIVLAVLSWFPEYGRWDDMLSLLDSCCNDVENEIYSIVRTQLESDIKSCAQNRPVSLLAKWMPSDNASSKSTRILACKLAFGIGLNIRQYRKTVVKLRSYLKVLERDLSANRWSEVDYSSVPSQANLLYRRAFIKHDHERRTAYLERVQKNGEKINAATLFPHDIVHRYGAYYRAYGRCEDSALEALWNNLPDYVDGESRTLVVRDGSGSMQCRVGGGSSVSAMSVSTALAIYFAERCSGAFKDQFITFSSHPKIVTIAGLGTLREKLDRCYREDECSNTNIEAVFDLILNTAISNNCTQNEIPSTILIVSDMEFDCATTTYNSDKTALFERIKARYERCGYQMPKLAFWNVCSRTNGIPLRENDNGVALVSGFSPATIKMVLQEETDPYLAMMNILDSDRYAPVVKALKSL